MQDRRMPLFAASLLAFFVAFSGTNALAATPVFTITATNVTMSSSGKTGTGSSSFTLTSVNGYAGSVTLNCSATNPPPEDKLPICLPSGPPASIPLTAGQVITGSISFYNVPVPVPASLPKGRGRGLASGLALAAALSLVFGSRRRAARWSTLTLFALCAICVLAGISACGANSDYVTPGTYAYSITAKDINTNAPVSSSFNVTVP